MIGLAAAGQVRSVWVPALEREPMMDDSASVRQSVYPGITPAVAAIGVSETLKVLGGRWKLTILFQLFGGKTLRFTELERAIPGVTQKMLRQQLRDLESHGVVRRVAYPVAPPKVEYSLTSQGEELCPALDQLLLWAQRHKGQPTSKADADRLAAPGAHMALGVVSTSSHFPDDEPQGPKRTSG
jgi:DNA-binding HxlR family transcriptional regulator